MNQPAPPVDLDALATEVGVQRHWTDAFGQEQSVDSEDLRAVLDALGWPCATTDDLRDSLHRQQAARDAIPSLLTTTTTDPQLPPVLRGASLRIEWEQGGALELRREADGTWPRLPHGLALGYHRLLHADGQCILAVAPPRCFGIADLEGPSRRLWGLATQIYALRGTQDAGFGDFGTLAQCAAQAGAQGVSALAISPVHAMFLADLHHYAPYSPSSRINLNVLYADPRATFSDDDIAAARSAVAHGAGDNSISVPQWIDWPEASRRKLALLQQLYSMRTQPIARLSYNPDDPTQVHACFEALHAHLSAAVGHVLALPDWPSALSSPRQAAVRAYAAEHADELAFHAWLQDLTRQSLAQTQQTAREAGMPIGLIADLAVGSDPHGSDAWAMGHSMLRGVSVGAPPDAFNRQGQGWGLTTFSPPALRECGYAPWLRMLRATMRDAGGIRIDHAMGLARLWLVPDGRDATHGVYAHLPADDLLRLLALESWRHRAIVIGEDLGTIPASLRRRLRGSGLLGMSMLWFEHDAEGHGYLPPALWPDDAVALSGSHDLPTLAGWWSGRDLEVGAASAADAPQRQHQREALWRSLHADRTAAIVGAEAGAGDTALDPLSTVPPLPPVEQPAAFLDAVCSALATAPAPLRLMPLEDIAGGTEQINLPGTSHEYPNWRLRHGQSVQALFARTDVRRRLNLLAGPGRPTGL